MMLVDPVRSEAAGFGIVVKHDPSNAAGHRNAFQARQEGIKVSKVFVDLFEEWTILCACTGASLELLKEHFVMRHSTVLVCKLTLKQRQFIRVLFVLRQFPNTAQDAVCELHVTFIEFQVLMDIFGGYPLEFGYLKRLRDKELGILRYRTVAGIRSCLSAFVVPNLDSALLRPDCHAPCPSKTLNRNAAVPVFSNLPHQPIVL